MWHIRVSIRHWTGDRVPCNLADPAACAYIAAGGNLFSLCQERTGGSLSDLVGISDYRACSLHGGICAVKENPEETLIKNNTETQVHGILSNDMFDIIKYD